MKQAPIIKTDYKYGFSKPEKSVFGTPKGLNPNVVEAISNYKNEPKWMREFRLKSLKIFEGKGMPTWGADLSSINFDEITYFLSPSDKQAKTWEEVPQDIKDTYDKIGIPEAEKKFLAGVGAQYDSEVIYHNLKKKWESLGVIFLDTDTALKKYPEIFKEYFGKMIPPLDNKFAALNSAVWSGGSFIYVPKGVHVDIPLQAYFRINAVNFGQFERTLIIADEGSFVHYTEGCTAPIYTTDSLHAAVVEIIVKKGARVRYSTVQNWSKNVYNLVTKRMFIEEEGIGEWIDGNFGSCVTMKYPSVYLRGRKAKGEILSLAFAGKDQSQDTGGKAIHFASETTSLINSKSISKDTGKTTFRGFVGIKKGAKDCKAKMSCHSLLFDDKSQASSFPVVDVCEHSSRVSHEATISPIEEDQLFYLQTRGISKNAAQTLIVNGFIEPIVKELPMEYAIELNRLIQMEIGEKYE